MMKNITKTLLFLVGLFVLPSLIVLAGNKPKEVKIPCADKGRSDAMYFRASNSAKSNDMARAKDKALMVTKQMLASLIGSTLQAVNDNFASSSSTEFKQSMQSISREVVNQQLKSVAIACEKTDKGKDGNYECFIAVEMPKVVLVEEIVKAVDGNDKLKVDFDKKKFEEIFDSEMKKLEN
ncbi:MAG TPA: hypothetical protein PK252_01740 [Bacteroidales bacterium]|nr:hypothetical protein [Bacteroidales bacterium]